MRHTPVAVSNEEAENMNNTDPIARYMPLSEALSMLPNIRARIARDALGEAKHEADASDDRCCHIAGRDIRSDELSELFLRDARGIARVSPRGARLLLQLYKLGAFEMKSSRAEIGHPEALIAYAESDGGSVEERPSAVRAARQPAAAWR